MVSCIYRVINAAIFSSTIVFSSMTIASHHFETPLSQANPEYDLTDLYVFDAKTKDKTAFILDINPTTPADGNPAFGDNGIYYLHLANDRDMSGGKTFSFKYSNNQITLGELNDANPAPGEQGNIIGSAEVGKDTTLANGIRIWSGAARDPFVGNSVGITKFRIALREGKFDDAAFNNKGDLFSALNTSSIAIEVPNNLLPKKIFVFATSAMLLDDQWVQVNRIANVLLTHLFLLSDEATSVEHVSHRPDEDHLRLFWVASTIARAAALNGSQANPIAYGDAMAKRLLPDMIPYQVGTKANYGVDAFNGRAPTDDAMDTVLSIFSGKAMTDHANTFDRHPEQFPHLVPLSN
ncbi:DUF4331 family protein [Enterovibrio norvegicus]|uniref:DUF4331 family protein n=1 Tax=Enterovibrio norvegicus TaxID=188144 RepID=UPI003553E1D5